MANSRLVRLKPKLRKALEEISRKNKIKMTDAGELIAENYNHRRNKKVVERIIKEWEF